MNESDGAVWYKALAGGDVALLLLNRGDEEDEGETAATDGTTALALGVDFAAVDGLEPGVAYEVTHIPIGTAAGVLRTRRRTSLVVLRPACCVRGKTHIPIGIAAGVLRTRQSVQIAF